MTDGNHTPKKFFFKPKLTPTISTPKISTPKLNFGANLRKKSTFHLFPVLSTPSPICVRLKRVVKNPFESHLTERLHLPVISSPSLFQQPKTPKEQSSNEDNFEWTIHEMSTLQSVNLTPHKTQYEEQYDSETEAKAQAAITTFFSENLKVPSPMNCILRNQKIVLNESTSSLMTQNPSDVISKNHYVRDSYAQTELTFPSELPTEVEYILSKYRIFTENQQQSFDEEHDDSYIANKSTMDLSTLRRKLFMNRLKDSPADSLSSEESREREVVCMSPAPKTPDFKSKMLPMVATKSNVKDESFNSSLFGELSPISSNNTPDEFKMDASNQKMCVDDSAQLSFNENEFGSVGSLNSMSKIEQSTPSTRFRRDKNLRRKKLSTSFVLLQDEFSDDPNDCKENISTSNSTNNQIKLASKSSAFVRYDSGFNEESNISLNFGSEKFETIDEMDLPVQKNSSNAVFKAKYVNDSFLENYSSDVSMQSEL